MTGVHPMAAADAQLFWLSASVPNDQLLVYGFDGRPDLDAGLRQVARTAESIEDLRLRIADDSRWRWPRWEPCRVSPEQFVTHPGGPWPDALAALSPLDATRSAWRVHVFPPRTVVVQISHALGDGVRSSALAAALFGRRAPLRPIPPPDRGFLPCRAVTAARTHRTLPPGNPPRPATSINAGHSGTPVLRMVLVRRDRLRRPTVTVGALSAISEALGGYLADRGEDTAMLGAEVPVQGLRLLARNNFRSVNVGLHPNLDRNERAERIARELADGLARARHPAWAASAAAVESMPPALLRWGTGRFDPHLRSPTVAGHTVVSSVNRGAADLSFGGATVTFTAGFPGLSPMMSLTHGVHGIGRVVAISIRADPVNVDVEDYLDRLTHALRCRP